jgi:translation elongation factor P/translation initiation factor 5A
MITAGDFRNGMTFEMDNNVFQVVEFQHVKPGKGAAFVRTKYKNIRTGAVLERSFNPNEKFESAQLERSDMSYLYADGDLYYFMNVETYDQLPFTAVIIVPPQTNQIKDIIFLVYYIFVAFSIVGRSVALIKLIQLRKIIPVDMLCCAEWQTIAPVVFFPSRQVHSCIAAKTA